MKLTRCALESDPGNHFRLEHAPRLSDAVLRLTRGGVDVAIIDLNLPDSIGTETVQGIHRTAPDVPIVVLTACDDEEAALETLQLGAQDYLFKDEFRPKLLVRSLLYAIERNRSSALESLNRQLEQAKASLTQSVKKLEQANEDLRQFTYFASHDLQAPLRKLVWYAEALRGDMGSTADDRVLQDLQFITESSQRMQSLVQALLALAHAGQAAIGWEAVDLNRCAEEVLERLSGQIAENIDDDPDVSSAIELHMRKYEVKVVRAFHGMHGFAEAIREQPNVIVMDLAMPSGDGATILEWLRRNRQTANIPVLILTGMRDRRLVQKLKNLDANRFLRKPIRLGDLMHQLGRFIDLRLRVTEVDEAIGEIIQ